MTPGDLRQQIELKVVELIKAKLAQKAINQDIDLVWTGKAKPSPSPAS